MLEIYYLPIIFIVVFAVMLFVFILLSKRIPVLEDKKFDERQMILRSTGFKYSFIIMIIYFALYGTFDLITGIKWCETFIGCLIGILIAVTFFSVYAIAKDSYEVTKSKKKYNIFLFAILAVVNFSIGFENLLGNNNIIEDGKLTIQTTSLLIFVMFLIIFIAYIIKNISDKKQKQVEKE